MFALQTPSSQGEFSTVSKVSPVYVAFGETLRRVREAKGLTQARLGELVSLDRSSISNIEAGRQRVALDTLFEFAHALAVDPHDLLPTAGATTIEDRDGWVDAVSSSAGRP
jgi:transcriptional regulator with XRE-family HTH domain